MQTTGAVLERPFTDRMKQDFEPRVVAAFNKVAKQRSTGALLCESANAKRMVFFRDGELVGSRSDAQQERFGHLLVVSGFLTEPQLDSAVRYIRSGKKLGEIMVELGYFNPKELAQFVRMQVRNVASAMLESMPTRIGFSNTPEIQVSTKTPVSVTEVFLHTASEIEDVSGYRESLDDPFTVYERTTSIGSWFPRLEPEHAIVWDTIDGFRSMGDIIHDSGVPEESVVRSLIGFLAATTVTARDVDGAPSPLLLSTQTAASTETAMASNTPASFDPDLDFFDESHRDSHDGSTTDYTPEHVAAVSTISIASSRLPTRPDSVHRSRIPVPQKSDPFVEELMKLKETVLHGNHWQTLGVPHDASKATILGAFHDLCSRFHPDAHADKVPSDRLADLNFVFARIHEAFLVLSEAPSSEQYHELVDKEEEYEEQKTAWVETPAETKPTEADPAKVHEMLGMAKDAYKAKDFWRTIQLCRQVIEHGDNQPETYFLLGCALSQNPRWRIDAEENLKIASKLEPWNTKYLIALGELYRREGLEKRAERTFMTARIIDPDVQLPPGVVAAEPIAPE